MKAVLLGSTLVMALALASGQAAAAEPQCTKNYSLEGSFFKGRTFKTWGEYPSVPESVAYKKIYAEIVKQGFQINHADKDVGIISASQGVTGSSKTVPLNASIEASGKKGSKVSLTFSTSGGLTVGEDGLKKGFCDILGAVGP